MEERQDASAADPDERLVHAGAIDIAVLKGAPSSVIVGDALPAGVDVARFNRSHSFLRLPVGRIVDEARARSGLAGSQNDLAAGPPKFLLVADDVVGGCYAIDGGALGKPGNIFYYAPDQLRWENTGKGYTDFLLFCLNGDLEKYYKDMRWPGWQTDIAPLKGDQGISIYPFPCAQGPDFGSRHRGFVPMTELYGLYVEDLPRKIPKR